MASRCTSFFDGRATFGLCPVALCFNGRATFGLRPVALWQKTKRKIKNGGDWLAPILAVSL
jgi:hypothetical protein